MSDFKDLQFVAELLLEGGSEAAARSAFIRFLDRFGGASQLVPVVDALSIRLGLFPYLMGEATRLSEPDALAVAYHSPSVLERRNFVFHAEQQKVYERLMDGANLILSAPTSFGKSAVIDALVLSAEWHNIVLIVPTIALIDETRRRLSGLDSGYTIISHPAQQRSERNIFVLTQERYLELHPKPEVDFFTIDEFYKLDEPGKQDERRSALNIAWLELRNSGAQYYLIGPNIDSLDERIPSDMRKDLFVSDYNTVVVDVEDRSSIDDPLSDLLGLLQERAEQATLVFVSSPARAARLAPQLPAVPVDSLLEEIADCIGRNYDESWFVVESLRNGVGVHTGPMPRSLQRAMVRLFELHKLNRLVCTTTLIEGVNTVAENVVIFDKKIDRKPIDFFTFSNIRGRAGRMLKHFVGKVISYAPLPYEVQSSVDIPIESQSDAASLATLLHIEDDSLSPRSKERLQEVVEQTTLSVETIRKNRGVDPLRQLAVAQRLIEDGAVGSFNIAWSGVPNATQLRAVVQLAYDELLDSASRRNTPNQIIGKLTNVRTAAGDISAMVERQMLYKFPNQTRSDVLEDILAFQRNWMGFKLPSMLRTISSIQNDLALRVGAATANYEFLIRELEGLYLPPFMADLEDYGLPLPLALKLNSMGLRGDSIEEVVRRLGQMARSSSVLTQLSRVERWFLSDVASGLEKEVVISLS